MTGTAPSSTQRVSGIDIARGIAIYLMFQSHTVKGLMFFKEMPEWGVVPMHTITKLSSSLFVLVFGVTLGIIFAPRTLHEDWGKTRNRLWWRALVVIFWYKILTIVQTFQTRPPEVVVEMLLYKKFPDFVEILDFYGWMLLLIPVFLPLWRRLPVWVGPLVAAALVVLGQFLYARWDFFGVPQLKAILVEDKKLFCFGLLTRGPMALLGLFIGDLIGRAEDGRRRRWLVAASCVVVGAGLLGLFYHLYHAELGRVLEDIARNRGKHPPERFFMLFSIGGSLVVLGFCLLIGGRGPWIFKPLEVLGRESLVCFVWHILAIFIGLRWLLGLKRVPGEGAMVTYEQALGWTLAVTAVGLVIAAVNSWRKRSARAVAAPVNISPMAAGVDAWREEPAAVANPFIAEALGGRQGAPELRRVPDYPATVPESALTDPVEHRIVQEPARTPSVASHGQSDETHESIIEDLLK